jgi:sugar lactone lactonase YvrE
VVRYDTAARPLERLDLPAAQVSSCTFAGEGLRTLLVTTARQGADAAQEYDAAGALFAVPTRIRGIAPGRLRIG